MIAAFTMVALMQVPEQGKGKPKTEGPIRPPKMLVGSVEVEVVSAKVAKVAVKSFNGTRKTDDEWLIIRIRVANKSDTKKIEYDGWGRRSGFDEGPQATVIDNYKNSFRKFVTSDDVEGQKGFESIYPGKIIEDILVFQKPIDKCRFVTLSLPGRHVDEKGVFAFDISAEEWMPKPAKSKQ
jgi:hypothetical protein